jgi:putative transposase
MAAEGIPVQVACRVLDVSVSGYYDWLSRPPSARAIRHAWLTDLIVEVHHAARGAYGARRVHAELRLGRGIVVGHGTIELLMRRAGLAGVTGRPKWRHAKPDQVAADLVDRAFFRGGPNQLWVTDITEHPTREGKVYCAVVLDAFSRRVVGWSIDASPTAALVTNALGMAIDTRTPPGGAIIHSDQGAQGGFNWSSQHLVDGGVDGDDARAAAGGAAVSGADPVAGSADGGVAAGSRPVLGGDCAGCQLRGRGAGDRRVVRGRGAVVPARWRREPLACPDGVGALSVLRRTRGHRHLARTEAGCARDRPAAEPVAVDDLAGVAAQRVHADLAAGVSGVDRAVARRTPRSSAQASEAGRQ